MRLVIIALAGLFLVSACGKKAPLRPPPSEAPQEDDGGR
jgi:predicted small lipoprotein YifL